MRAVHRRQPSNYSQRRSTGHNITQTTIQSRAEQPLNKESNKCRPTSDKAHDTKSNKNIFYTDVSQATIHSEGQKGHGNMDLLQALLPAPESEAHEP